MSKQVTVELYGDVHTFEIEEDETILDAALRNDLDAPYACMSGTCNSCQAKVMQGEVRMEDAEALSDDEIESGEILTCCAYVVSEDARVRYPD